MPHASIFWRLDYHRSLYVSFIIHLRASESSVSRITYHYINLLEYCMSMSPILTFCWLECHLSHALTYSMRTN